MSEEIKNEDVASTETTVESTPVVEETVEEVAVEAAPVVVEEVEVAAEPVAEVVAEAEKEVITNAVKAPKSSAKKGLAPVEGGAIGSTVVTESKPTPAPKKSAAASADDSVAIQSTRNVVWQGVGKVSRGVNIVSKAEAEQWLTRSHVTLLTPEQVAKEFNK